MTGNPTDRRSPVLVLRALGLGDALTAVPALRGLRRAFPGRPLLLAAAGPPARLLSDLRLVDDVVPTPDLDAAPPGRNLGEHVAVNLHGRGPRSHRLLLAAEPARVVAFGCPITGIAGPVWHDGEHEVQRWCRLARWAGGWCAPAELRLGGEDRAGARRGPVIVHPGASTRARRWPTRRFAAVARALSTDGHPVVVTGSSAEAELTGRVVSLAGLDPSADLAGRLDLGGLADLLGSSRLLIVGDTGVGHLATAFGTPSVRLFGPEPPHRWAPLIDPDRHRVLWHGRSGPPAHPQPTREALLRQITVAEVLAAASSVLAGAAAGAGGATAPDQLSRAVPTSLITT